MEESTLDTAAETADEENAGAYDGWDEAETPADAEPSGEERDAAEEEPEETEEAFLTLESGGESRRLTREETRELARKGLEFDQVQEALQSLQEQQTVSAPALDLVRQYARQNGMTEEQYLGFCRGRMQGGTPENRQGAQLRAAMEQTRRQAAVRRDVQAFLRDYPDVKAQDIPDEVWADMHENGVSMSAAYGRYRIRSLQQEVDASRAAATSRRRSAGSLAGSLPLNNAADPAFLGWED